MLVDLRAGLGNQLFQYAAAMTIARELNATLLFNGLGSAGIELDRVLGVDLPAPSPGQLHELAISDPSESATSRALHRAKRQLRVMRGNQLLIQQVAFRPKHADVLQSQPSYVHMWGDFQHPSWFVDSLDAVSAQLRCGLGRHATELEVDATVISFRRGDYVRLGWDLPLAYYERALAQLPAASGPTWVVCDDQAFAELAIPWFRDRGVDVQPLPDIAGGPLIRDLLLLSRARRVIMSNSTFCWWGVATGDLDPALSDRTVIAPSPWLPAAPAGWGAESSPLLRSGWQTV